MLVFQLRLTNISGVLVLNGMITRVTSFLANLPEACNSCWSATLELIINGGFDKICEII